MNKLGTYVTEICTKIKAKYPQTVFKTSLGSAEFADAVISVHLPKESDENFAAEIGKRTMEILLNDDLLIATLWCDSGRSWKRLTLKEENSERKKYENYKKGANST